MNKTVNPEHGIEKKPSKIRGRLLRGVVLLLLSFLVCYGIFALFIPKKDTMPFFEAKETPLVIAHQGGNMLAPSSTFAAFDKAVELGVDVLEYDLHITKDGQLVLIHDPTVDRTTNGQGRVEDLTLEEIQALDAGYTFTDLSGELSYRGQGLYIPTLEEMFQRYGQMLHNIEMKNTNSDEHYEEIYEKLWTLIQKYNMEDKVLIFSFDHQMIKDFQQLSEGRVAVSAGRAEIIKFVAFHKLLLSPFYRTEVQALQIPVESDGFNLADATLTKGAKRHHMQLHYWTINDEEAMRALLELGADGIITDRPDLLMEIIADYK
ncbi:glycerophosphodiester phosphodiesterase [Bacillus horti]|uniref:Glycerophosphoryl diester phosphodiesterase n=1 Tax=Caldalkalibacillus horti TaxID=77523 RepID=A0ABT9VXS8_9BACI|nr:glycerophosphodiester phosphodiesterase [Bacillus horti]MDQ0165806.1 glycerophosphoryl diester phosphodiesterase [Bacillus horti]